MLYETGILVVNTASFDEHRYEIAQIHIPKHTWLEGRRPISKRRNDVCMEPIKKRKRAKPTALMVVTVEPDIDGGVMRCRGLLIKRPVEATIDKIEKMSFKAFQDLVKCEGIKVYSQFSLTGCLQLHESEKNSTAAN